MEGSACLAAPGQEAHRSVHRSWLESVMAEERDIRLFPGVRYYAGVSLPWYVPRGIVTSAVKEIGFKDVEWHPRAERPPVDPHDDPSYSDDWENWATAVYQGPTQLHHLSHAPAWIVTDTELPAEENFPLVQHGQHILSLVNGTLASHDPATIRQAARYFEERNMRELAADLRAAADTIDKSKPERVAQWAAIGGILLTTVGLFVATLGFAGRKPKRRAVRAGGG